MLHRRAFDCPTSPRLARALQGPRRTGKTPRRAGGSARGLLAVLITAIIVLGWSTLGLAADAIQAPAALAQSLPPGTLLGGLDLNGYCAGLGYDHSDVVSNTLTGPPNIGPNAAFDWACIAAAGSSLPSPYRISRTFDDMYLPCEAQYPGDNAVPTLGDPNDAYTWNCVVGSGGPPGGLISGRVCISSDVNCPSGGITGGIDGAPVTACATNVSTSSGTVPFFCVYTVTASGGYYTLGDLPAGLFDVTADPPPGTPASSDQIQNVAVGTSSNLTENFSLPVLPGATTSGIEGAFGSPPTIDSAWSSYTFDTFGCPGGTFSYSLTLAVSVQTKTGKIAAGTVLASGPMTQISAAGGVAHYQAVYGRPLAPAHGKSNLVFSFNCPVGGSGTSGNIPIYIDPSGTVVNQDGRPVAGATVTLYYSPIDAGGPFSAVANGSVIMSPGNRQNPTTTGADGAFGWDVLPGYYEVVATRPGCTGPDLTNSPVLTIPPAVTDLTITLQCNDTRQPKVHLMQRPDRMSGDTSARFTFQAEKPHMAQADVTYECKLDNGVFTACDSPAVYHGLTPGWHTFTVHATDSAGNTSDDVSYRWQVKPHDGDSHDSGQQD